MSIQDETDKLIKQVEAEQKRVEDLTNSIVGNKQENLDTIIRNIEKEKVRIVEQASNISSQKQQEMNNFIKQQTEGYTAEELAYINSPYYQNYQKFINNLEMSQVAANLNQRYLMNQNYFKDPFYDGLSLMYYINGIGFPIPDRFVDELKQIIDSKLQLFVQFDKSEFKTKIEQLKYLSQSENYAKKLDAYLITISLQKTKTNIETKTK